MDEILMNIIRQNKNFEGRGVLTRQIMLRAADEKNVDALKKKFNDEMKKMGQENELLVNRCSELEKEVAKLKALLKMSRVQKLKLESMLDDLEIEDDGFLKV